MNKKRTLIHQMFYFGGAVWIDMGEEKQYDMGVSKYGRFYPPNHPCVHRVFHYKPSILGYHYFWKHPYL